MTQNNADASAVSEGEMTANALLEALGTTLEPDLLVEALTHRSFSHENPGAKNYERLEFLGDAVLELVSTETLYKAHPDMNEGQLAKMRAKAVSEESLSKIAREKLNAGPYILLGHGESDQGGADKSSILCDIVESLIGATASYPSKKHSTHLTRHVALCIILLTKRLRKSRRKAQPSIGKPRLPSKRMAWASANRATRCRFPVRNMRKCSLRTSCWAKATKSSAPAQAPASARRNSPQPKKVGRHWTIASLKHKTSVSIANIITSTAATKVTAATAKTPVSSRR